MIAEKNDVLVWGLGWSGVCAANLLVAQGYNVAASDTRTAEALQPALDKFAAKGYGLDSRVTLILGEPHHHHGCPWVILTQSIKHHAPCVAEARAAAAHVMPEVELAASSLRESGVRVAAIGGTDGKTTTTKLAYAMVSASYQSWVGGNSWPPLSSIALKVLAEVEAGTLSDSAAVVAEVSAFQLPQWHAFHPFAGAVTNLAEDHVDEYFEGDFSRYVAAKRATIECLGAGEFAVLNADDPLVASWDSRVVERGATPVYVSLSTRRVAAATHAVYVSNGEVRVRWDGVEVGVCMTHDLPVIGDHNIENLLIALAVTWALDLDLEKTRAAIRAFDAPAHRLQFVREVAGVSYYDDSKATNAHASLAGLNAFGGKTLVPIVGGIDKGLDLDSWVRTLNAKSRVIVVIGELRQRLERDYGHMLSLQPAESMEDAVRLAASLAEHGDVVVLSPACSSFDMFSGYVQRGQVFHGCVHDLES